MYKSNPLIVRMVALLVLPALFTMESAFAADTAAVPPSVTVRYNDLNLDSTAEVTRLYKRIENAATEVCKPLEGLQSLSRMTWRAWNQCFYHAVAKAVRTVHNESLSAYHWQRVRGWDYREADAPASVARR